MWDEKSAEGAPTHPRGSLDTEQVTYSPQLVGEKPVPEHQILWSWAPAPPQVAAEIRQAAKQRQVTSQGWINENYWARTGAGYQKKPTMLPSAAVRASKVAGAWESGKHNKWLSNPNSHLRFKSLKPICIQQCTHRKSKSRTEDPYITVQGSSQTRQVLQAAVRLWQRRHVGDILQSMP